MWRINVFAPLLASCILSASATMKVNAYYTSDKTFKCLWSEQQEALMVYKLHEFQCNFLQFKECYYHAFNCKRYNNKVPGKPIVFFLSDYALEATMYCASQQGGACIENWSTYCKSTLRAGFPQTGETVCDMASVVRFNLFTLLLCMTLVFRD